MLKHITSIGVVIIYTNVSRLHVVDNWQSQAHVFSKRSSYSKRDLKIVIIVATLKSSYLSIRVMVRLQHLPK